MNTLPLRKIVSALCCYLALLGFAHAADSDAVPMGDNTYSITRKASSAFHRDTDVLKANAKDAAAKFCAAQSKEMKIISLTSERPLPTLGYAKAKIVFKALAAGDPELTRQPEPTIAISGTQVQANSGDLYSDLIKLDDLRKKGILTDDEFQVEKKKLLKRNR